MATAPNLYFPSYSFEREGADKQDKENTSRRLANRDALLKMSEEAAAQGQSLTIEDLMRQSSATMGFNDFLRSTSPSVDMMQGIVQNQNAKAAQVAEERRRTQFQADANEGKTLTEEAKGLFLAGRSAVDVDAELRSKYGEDRVSKLRPQLDRIGGMAQHEAMKSGMEVGKTRFQNEFEAKEYVANNSWLPKPEAEGILIGARNNQSAVEKSIMDNAYKLGSTGGWRGTADDALLAQSTIDTMAGSLPAEQKAALAKRFLETAGSAARQFESASDFKFTQNAREAQAKAEPELQFKALQLDAQDQERREKDAKLAKQGYLTAIQMQQEQAKALDNPKHPMSKEGKVEASAGLRSYYFKDPSAYLAAVEKGDAKEVARIKSQAIPIADYLAKADLISEVVSGAHKSPNISALYSRMSEFGADSKLITELGREIQSKQKLQAIAPGITQAAPSVSAPAVDNDPSKPYIGYPGVQRSVNRPTGQQTEEVKGSEIRRAAAATEAVLRRDFIADSAEYLKEVRQAISSNGRVSATPEQIQAEERKVATTRAIALVKGMGLTGPAAEATVNDFIAQILTAAGSATPIEQRQGYGDMFRQANSLLGDRRGLPDSLGRTPAGAVRTQGDPRYAPANF